MTAKRAAPGGRAVADAGRTPRRHDREPDRESGAGRKSDPGQSSVGAEAGVQDGDRRDENCVLERVAQAPEPDPAERQTHLVDERRRDVEHDGQHDQEAREGLEALRVGQGQDRGDESRHTAHTDPPARRADGECPRETRPIGDRNGGDEARKPGRTSKRRRRGGKGHER